MKKRGFTLAEVLITLAIIGVVAAISIPSVISNSQQQEFKTGLRKAVSVLNSAITMNMAIDGESPYDNADLFNYLQRHMAIIDSTTMLSKKFAMLAPNGVVSNNGAFYTTDGMRFEFLDSGGGTNLKLYEDNSKKLCFGTIIQGAVTNQIHKCGGCGSLGLKNNVDQTQKPPCGITVDVNGDRRPNPANVDCKNASCAKPAKFSDPLGLKLTDMFTIMITDKQAIPYGVAAQRAMYQAQK